MFIQIFYTHHDHSVHVFPQKNHTHIASVQSLQKNRTKNSNRFILNVQYSLCFLANKVYNDHDTYNTHCIHTTHPNHSR